MNKTYTYIALLLGLVTLSYNPSVGQCLNISAYASANAPTGGATTLISSCQYASEYATINSVTANTTYESTTDLVGGFFTVTEGTPTGTVVGFGVAPLTWSSNGAGTYYIHLTVDATCTQAFNCQTHSITHIGSACSPIPTTPSVSASTSTVCTGSSTQLNAVSAGSTIFWYTSASGGTSIGSGSSITVTPTAQTTYYAEADNGSCTSTRTAITIATVPSPAAPTNVTTTAGTICEGDNAELSAMATGSSIIYDFTSTYDPSNWAEGHSPSTDLGTIDATGAPNTLGMTSSDGGSFGIHMVTFTITVPSSGNISFDWDYVTTDVDGPFYDKPQYSINGAAFANIPNFDENGLDIQAGSSTIAVNAGDVFSLSMTATDDIMGAATTIYSNFEGPGLGSSDIDWYTVSTGGTSIGTASSGATFPVSPTTTTTYYAEAVASANSCPSATRVPVTVNVQTLSTTPTATPVIGHQCPNTNLNLSATGGTAGTGSSIYWYTGPNGSGTAMGTGGNLAINTGTTGSQTYYIRREGTCNTTADATVTVDVKDYVYGLNGASSVTYCTDNSGWHHFYSGNEILLSIQGDISGADPGYPQISIADNGSFFQTGQGPFAPTSCAASGLTPGEERFEMSRSWNVDFGPTGTYNPPYNVRFYYDPAEKAAIEAAAAAWIAAYPACGYSYKYNSSSNGFYWFKNAGSAYTAPQWDGTHHSGSGGAAGVSSTNYSEWTNVTSFSGGTGGIILVPNSLLNTEWTSFDGSTNGEINTLSWELEQESATSHFNILRSKDGVVFENIATVAAKGTVEQGTSYQYIDEQPLEGTNYYKIELVYLSQKTSSTHLVSLDIKAFNTGYGFYPNPSTGKVYYQYNASNEDVLNIEVMDMLGKKLKEETVTSQVGLNDVLIELDMYPEGSYMVRVHNTTTDNVHTSKIIKR
ncbi:MAG: T9SS type A sorting domain-containing protein [Saprospiraceae bacterium]|nr:T9SS type A sorting domain-containing protein [Saprospiraceae bacterium]